MIGFIFSVTMWIAAFIFAKNGTVDPIIIAGMLISSAIFYVGFYIGLISSRLGDIKNAIYLSRGINPEIKENDK